MFHEKGFTILEVVLAIFILTCGVVGAFALIQQTLSSIAVLQAKLTASYLTQEGIEIAKNIRDSNWLEQRVDSSVLWDDGLAEGNWQVDFKNQILPYDSQGYFLNIDSSGFYSYSLGSATVFKRKISFSEKTDLDGDGKPDKMKISVEVNWEERGRTHTVEAIDYLYNWYGSREEKPSSEVCHSGGVPQTCDGEDATLLDCNAGQEPCRRCLSGICTYYTSGQHGCAPNYACNIFGSCVSSCFADGDDCSSSGDCCSGSCYVDADGDRYAPSSGAKKCQAASQLSGTDCDDSNASKWQNLTCYRDADSDTYYSTAGSSICTGASCPVGYSGTQGNDCYDSNANANPGQASWFSSHRGDGSFDYNCDGLSTKAPWLDCVTSYSVTACTMTMPTTTGGPGFVTSVPACGATGAHRVCWNNNSVNCTGSGSGTQCGQTGCPTYYPMGSWSITEDTWQVQCH